MPAAVAIVRACVSWLQTCLLEARCQLEHSSAIHCSSIIHRALISAWSLGLSDQQHTRMPGRAGSVQPAAFDALMMLAAWFHALVWGMPASADE